MFEAQKAVQARYEAALTALTEKLKQDRYILAAVVYGSVARGEAWERSDIDLTIIQRDGLPQDGRYLWLVEDGINISASLVSRSRFRKRMEGVLQGSFVHSIHSQSKLLFSKDSSIEAWFQETDRIGARDQALQLLKTVTWVPPVLDKAEKWFYVKNDLDYSFVWLIQAVNNLARVEVVLNSEAPGREVIYQALKYNPVFFKTIYTDLIHGPKDRAAIEGVLGLINAYLAERAEQLFKPILDYLAEADGVRTASELDAYFKKKLGEADLFWSYEWLARQGIVEKVAAPIRLTYKSQVALEEPAYYYDTDDLTDWE